MNRRDAIKQGSVLGFLGGLIGINVVPVKEEAERNRKLSGEVISDNNVELDNLCEDYIDHVLAMLGGTKVKHKFTQEDCEPDEKLMRSVEVKINIPEPAVYAFRYRVAFWVAVALRNGEKFKWDTNTELAKAFQAKLFDETKSFFLKKK